MRHFFTLLAVVLSLSAFAQNESDKATTGQAPKQYREMTINEFLSQGKVSVRLDDGTMINISRRRKVDYCHEVRFSVGAWSHPGFGDRAFGGCVDINPRYYDYAGGGDFLESHATAGTRYYTGAYTLYYNYHCTRVIGLGVSFTYAGMHTRYHEKDTHKQCGSLHENFMTPMLLFRVAWLNRKLVRMYSYVGAGLGIEHSTKSLFDRHSSSTERFFSGQITPVGISVGRRLYGFAEIGYGAHGIAIAGIGYKF